MSNTRTISRHDGSTGEYTIYSLYDCDVVLLAGNASLDEFHRLNAALRQAERIARQQTALSLETRISEIIARDFQ